MKKILYLASLMLVVTFSTAIYSCSSDDDESFSSSYTSDEIKELLKGKWSIKGICRYGGFKTPIDTTYTGEIEFLDNSKIKISSSKLANNFTITRSSVDISLFIRNDEYSVLKKGGDTYLEFRSSYFYRIPYIDMKIVKLSKNSFKLVYDDDFGYYDDALLTTNAHLYLTIESN